MIVSWSELPSLAGTVVMVDGSFDPLHDGHIAYFQAAASLGLPVLCNIATDHWTSTKHPILLPQLLRARVVDAIRYISYVHCATNSTRDVLERLRPHTYVKGSDWKERGGIPAAEAEVCASFQIQVRYVDTVLNSSSQLLEQLKRP
jgi:glycerol-3-phosphate cytidylyltransferase-like family protein